MKSCGVSSKFIGILAVAAVLTGMIFSALAQEPKPPEDQSAQRAKLPGAIPPSKPGAFESKPNEQGDYVYEASSAKVLLTDGPAKLTLEADKIVPGLTTMRLDTLGEAWGAPDNKGLYWKLGDIKAGKYWIGVVYESQANFGPGQVVEGPWNQLLGIFLNGRNVQCSSLGNPAQVAPDVWFAELQAAAAESLRPGDEIALAGRNMHLRVARLALHTAEPARGPFKVGANFGGQWWSLYTNLMLEADAMFVDAGGGKLPSVERWVDLEQYAGAVADLKHNSDGKPVAIYRIMNPLPVDLTVDYEAIVRGYYQKVVGRDAGKLTVPAHTCLTREAPFEPTADDPGYTVIATVKAVNPPDLSAAGAGLGWPEADTVEFFPFLRQSAPWVGSFEHRSMRRLDLQKPLDAPRQRHLLDGQWEHALTTSLVPPMPVPDDMKFKPIFVPGSVALAEITPRPHGGYFRRTVELPADTAGKTYRMIVSRVTDEATLYVNGVKAGNVRGGYTPLVADVTSAIKPGRNEIVLVVRDILAIMDQDYVNREAPEPSQMYLDAPGIGGNVNIAVGKVRLEVSPAVAASQILVISSVRNKTLSAKLELTNHLDRAVKVRVKATIMDADKVAFELGQKEAQLDQGAGVALGFDKAWDSPRLWSPADPHLYTLALETADAESGERLDLAQTRFGFRESWIDKNRIMFNGSAIKLKGGGWPCGTGIDVNYSRGTKTPEYFDEIGALCCEYLTDVTNSSSKHNVEREIFWESARQNCLAGAKELLNHPCIIAWDLSNEWLCFLGYSGGDGELGARQMKSMSDVLAELDPTRWTLYDGDGDLFGLHNTYSGHYMLGRCPYYHTMYGFGFDGHSGYFPDCAYWRPLDKDFKPGEAISLNAQGLVETARYGEKVVMDTENLWKVSGYMPPGPCKFIGEDDVVSDAYDTGGGPVVWMWKQNLDAHRDLGMNHIGPYGRIPGVLRRGYALQCFIMPDTIHHGFSGRKFARRYDVLNDLFRPAKLTLRWALLGSDGKSVANGQETWDMACADLRRSELSFALPDVKERTKFTLDLRLEEAGKLLYGEQQDIEVWPDTAVAAGKLARQVFLFDPKGKTAEVLKRSDVSFTAVDKLAPQAGEPAKTLVMIGEDALSDETAGSVAALVDFVAAGGRVLILAQSVTPGGLPADTKLEPREWSSQPFVAVPTHPVLRGITTWDLHFWAPDRVSARGAYTKPESGAATPLVDSGTDTGLEWVQMMEIYRGKGLYLLCQLPLAASYNAEPMARELLARTVRYAAGEVAYRCPTQRFKVITVPDSPVAKSLSDVGVAFDAIQPSVRIDSASVALIDASAPARDEDRQAWAGALANGATLVVCRARPQDASWLTKLAGRPVNIAAPPYRMWEGRGYRQSYEQPVAGLSQIDLYWKRYSGVESATNQAVDAGLMIEPLQDYAAWVEGADELVFPGVLVQLNVGKGVLLIDQRRWMTPQEKLRKLADRNLSALALGLNVGIAPAISIRELPKGVTYLPVGLSAFANRALADETPDDGVGGWTDQGPTGDLRSFPTGNHTFAGVPFNVPNGPKSIIVLACKDRPGADKLHGEVTIPLGQKLEGLCFLHGFAYTGENGTEVGLYQVQYEDGAKADIPLCSEVNVRDWSGTPGPMPREKGTSSAVAWTGSVKMFLSGPMAVYRMTWVNPRPEIPIKALRFAHPTRLGVPVLMGLTAILGPDQKQTAQAADKARELFAQAVKESDAGKARELLKQAIAADAGMSAAHQALADLYEKAGDQDAALKTYQDWAAAGASTPLPYNRIGQILEKRKDYKGALDAYSQSLKIEWNQPPTIEAKAQMEKLLRE